MASHKYDPGKGMSKSRMRKAYANEARWHDQCSLERRRATYDKKTSAAVAIAIAALIFIIDKKLNKS